MSGQLRFFGGVSFAVLAIAAGITICITPGVTISAPSQAASIIERYDGPAPQRFEFAQSAQPAGANAGRTASGLPGGASSLSETYRDWRVACVQDGTAKRCSLSQVQARQEASVCWRSN